MKKISFKDLPNSGAVILSRAELKQVYGGDVDCAAGFVKVPLIDDGPGQYGCLPQEAIYGTPGGDNGDPCPAYCAPVGGVIHCIGGGIATGGNCNTLPPSQSSGRHNACINLVNGSFWC